ncbi:MAG: MBL fold metallo-hydrolase [Synergistaceae bacterium]|nr:MBL fold metallo-hydrolase [Synergistaceae bacterium]
MSELKAYAPNFIKYLGTGGARFCMIRQARRTGGIWFSYGGLAGVIDPGPGSLVHICGASPELDPHSIRAILLTHRHLDHGSDINVIAEAMTGGGFEKQGTIVLPKDAACGEDPVLLKYIAQKIERICLPEDGSIITLDCGVTVEPVAHVHHRVDCFGFIFRKEGLPTWGVISDTKPLDYLAKRYRECSYISINATFPDKKPRLEHMSITDVGELLQELHPKLATISHMGLVLLENGPEAYAKQISTDQTRVVAGQDGMVINLETLKVLAPVERPKEETEYRAI